MECRVMLSLGQGTLPFLLPAASPQTKALKPLVEGGRT